MRELPLKNGGRDAVSDKSKTGGNAFMRPRFTRRRTGIAVAAACYASLGLAAVEPHERTGIPAQNLGSALQMLAKQRGFHIVYFANDVGDLPSGGAAAGLSTEKALRQLLDGTGLAFRYLDENTVTIGRVASVNAAALASNDQASNDQASNEQLRLARGVSSAPNPAGNPSGSSVEETAPAALEEIVVTAQRRAENMQQIPLAIKAISAGDLESSGIDALIDLEVLVPGLTLSTSNGQLSVKLRGIGSGGIAGGNESAVAVYVDDVYYATAGSALMSLNNVEQIAVLKGPQGTLFGRNATGGVIQVTTADPRQDFSGRVSAGYGNYETAKSSLYLTGGLTDNFALDLAATGTTMGKGYGKNFVNGEDVYKVDHDYALRSKGLLTLGDTEVRMTIDFADSQGSSNAGHIAPGASAPPPYGPTHDHRPWDVTLSDPTFVNNNSAGVSLKVNHPFTAAEFMSLSAYRRNDMTLAFDADITAATPGRTVRMRQEDYQLTQEFQLLSPESSRVKWTMGAFYFKTNVDQRVRAGFAGVSLLPTVPPTSAVLVNVNPVAESWAGYAQATLPVLDALSVTAGLRYTHEDRFLHDGFSTFFRTDGSVVVGPATSLQDSFAEMTWRLAVDYRWSPDLMTYVSYNRGFKSGGFNTNTLTLPPYNPEILDAYELGFKATLLDGRMRFNGAAFFNDYQDIQVARITIFGSGIANAEGVESYGFETDATMQVTPHLNLTLGYQFLHSEYVNYPGAQAYVPSSRGGYTATVINAAGRQVSDSPKHSANLTALYTVPLGRGDVDFNATYFYSDASFGTEDNEPGFLQPSYGSVNASMTWRRANGSYLALWGNNLTDEEIPTTVGAYSVGGGVYLKRFQMGSPRTYGMTLGMSF